MNTLTHLTLTHPSKNRLNVKMKALLFILMFAAFSFGKSADDYLHEGAYQYIAEKTQEASVTVDEGLSQYPDDSKLQNLSELLKQMKNQQRQDQNQSGGGDSKQNQKNQDQKNKNDQNKNDQNKNDQKNGQNKDQQNKDQKNDPNKGQNPKDKQGQDKNQQQQPKPEDQNGQPHDTSGQQGQGAPAKRLPGQMSKDEAERLLNSYIDEEKQAQQNRQEVPKKRLAPGQQDW